MLCFKYRKLIIPYSEGALDERTRAGMEAHLSSCEACRQELEAVQSVSSVLRSMDEPATEPAPDLWAKVSARIADDTVIPAPRPWLRVTQAASALAVVALVTVVGFGVFQKAPDNIVKTGQTQVARVLEKPGSNALLRGKPMPNDIASKSPAKQAPEPAESSIASASIAKNERLKTSSSSASKRYATRKEEPILTASADLPPEHSYFRSESPKMADRAADSTKAKLYYDSAGVGAPKASMSFRSVPGKRDEANAKDGLEWTASAEIPAPANSFKATYSDEDSARSGSSAGQALACAAAPATASQEETAVDALNRTEGVHIAAMFQYP